MTAEHAPHADSSLRLLRRRVFDTTRTGAAIRLALILALALHLALGTLFIIRPPAFLAALHRRPQAPREAEIEIVQNNLATEADAPVGGNNGASAAPQSNRPTPQARATPPSPPIPHIPSAPSDIPATPPPQQAQQAHPADQIQMNLTGSDSAQGVSGGTADTQAAADPKAHNKLPAYPRNAGALGEHGTVTAVVFVTPDGHAGSVVVQQTSGWPALDSAAVQAWQTWHFKPAITNGAPAPSQITVSIDFTLNHP